VRNNCVRAHAAMFSNQYSWCSPPSTALRFQGEDAVPVMDEEVERCVAGERFSQLL
jgi:hypothetical protein